jgi:hypothetical protein
VAGGRLTPLTNETLMAAETLRDILKACWTKQAPKLIIRMRMLLGDWTCQCMVIPVLRSVHALCSACSLHSLAALDTPDNDNKSDCGD